MKWFFCWCEDTDFRADHNWKDLIRAAVASAWRNTSLEPHLIYDGNPSDFTTELAAAGVNVIFHRLSFTSAIAAHTPDKPQWQAVSRGAFLRFDIPLVAAREDEIALYTDADVIFQHMPDFTGYLPPLLAAAPQFDRGSRQDMNSGVMLLNLHGWRALRAPLLEFTTANLNLGLDQEVLRAFVGPRYTQLPDTYNWKPYWGVNTQAPIVHWHGPKPQTVAALLDGTVTHTHEAWQELFARDHAAYAHYLALHREMLAGYWSGPLRSKPSSRLSAGRPTTHSNAAGDDPWWQVDLGGFATIREIRIHGPAGGGSFSLGVSIDGESWTEIARKGDDAVVGGADGAPFIWDGPGTAWARFVRVTLLGRDYLHLDQVEVFGAMTHPGGRL